MTTLTRTTPFLLATLALSATLGALGAPARAQDARPAIPATPAPVTSIVSIQPFELEAPTRHLWRAERPAIRSGYLLVLRVDPALVLPRQVAEPVLYVGHQTAERVNVGYESGHVVAILPAVLDPEHPDHVDLAEQTLWFGTPELPERVDARRIASEHALAQAAGIRPFPPEAIAAARKRGGETTQATDKRELVHDAMRRLVLRYSPQERALVEGVLEARPTGGR